MRVLNATEIAAVSGGQLNQEKCTNSIISAGDRGATWGALIGSMGGIGGAIVGAFVGSLIGGAMGARNSSCRA